jgi:hypothetical protein
LHCLPFAACCSYPVFLTTTPRILLPALTRRFLFVMPNMRQARPAHNRGVPDIAVGDCLILAVELTELPAFFCR